MCRHKQDCLFLCRLRKGKDILLEIVVDDKREADGDVCGRCSSRRLNSKSES